MPANRHRAGLLLFGPAAGWLLAAALGLAWTAGDSRAWTAIDRHAVEVVGASTCRECHADAWQSWHASWHRTMTQRPSPGGELPLALATSPEPAIVLAPFAGETLDYLGFRATMDRGSSGAPRIRVNRITESGELGEATLDVEVALTVGSHRYQQYVGAIEGELWRLPVAWHRGEARWIHMNGAFVEPEGESGSLADYQRHLGRWNDNCIFCHNTEPVPGLQRSGHFASEVGELGIACEACHGPAAAHLERHRNPLRRMLAGRDRGDGSITQPGRLDAGRESAICGRCHGQRIARDISTVMAEGDGFVPGDSLAEVSRPIFADSAIGTEPMPFAMRFWPDGTPRLSAYEYQGLLLSACHDSGEGLGCNHCHDMHGDDPSGQLRAGRAGQGACHDCHDLDADHGGHRSVESVDCLDCHMPPITYGLLEGMISHRITSPDPGALVGRHDQPDACTQCHVDRSRRWAAESMATLGLRGSPAGREDPLEARGSRVLLDLHGGDPIQRNLAAHALAQPDASGAIADRMVALAGALEDEYPSVRWFAWRGLRALAEARGEHELVALLADFDYLGPIDARVEVLGRIHARLGSSATGEALFDDLAEARAETAIWIGE
ncbi:hypothetical protein ACNOYE_35590 [Nannocystaceae bacterium ST9]